MVKNIAVIRGDGIGPEITEQALLVLDRIAEVYNHKFNYIDVDMGGCAIDKFGEPLPDAELKKCKESDSVLLGAVGGSKWDNIDKNLRPEKGLLKLRSSLGVYSNNRPAKIWNQLKSASPLKDAITEKGVDFIIFNNSRPTNLIFSGAVVRKKDSEKIEEICKAEKKFPRVLINHYPIIEKHPLLRFRHRLYCQGKIAELLKKGVIDLSICGHRHFYYTDCNESGRGEICSGSVTKNGLMSEIEYKDDAFNFKKIYLNQ